jgi:hypothetical protein
MRLVLHLDRGRLARTPGLLVLTLWISLPRCGRDARSPSLVDEAMLCAIAM